MGSDLFTTINNIIIVILFIGNHIYHWMNSLNFGLSNFDIFTNDAYINLEISPSKQISKKLNK
jgi:hypothetical protein